MAAAPRLSVPGRVGGTVKPPLSLVHAIMGRQQAPPQTYPVLDFSKAPVTATRDPVAEAAARATRLANQQVAAQVQSIQQQQQQAQQQAAQRAAQINQASLAAAHFLSGLGNQTAADYKAAQQAQQGLGQGYSGQLRDDAAAQAAQAQQSLGAVAGNTQTVTDRGPSLANLLYGLGADLPGRALITQGLGATAAARALPGGTFGYGQQAALGQLAAGKQTVDSLTQQILNAEAQRPQIQQSLLSQLQGAAVSSQQAANQSAEIQSLIDARGAGTRLAGQKYADTQVPHFDPARSKLAGEKLDQFGQPMADPKGYRQILPGFHWVQQKDGTIVPEKDVTTKTMTAKDRSDLARKWSATNHYKSDWQGHPAGGKITPLAGYKLSPDGLGVVSAKASAAGGITPTSLASSAGKLGKWVDSQLKVSAPKERLSVADPKTGLKHYQYWNDTSQAWQNTVPQHSVNYQDLLQQAIAQGPVSGPGAAQWRKQAIAAVQSKIPMGYLGRPFEGGTAVRIAAATAKEAAAAGTDSLEQAIGKVRQLGLIPDRYLLPAMRKAFAAKAKQAAAYDRAHRPPRPASVTQAQVTAGNARAAKVLQEAGLAG